MAGGVPAGTLSIEIMANVARLQQDMEKVKRSVGDMATSTEKSTRAANDNMGRLTRGLNGTIPSARMASFGMRNLGFQVQDLGVQFATAAGSSDPLRMSLMALAMQGPQIRDAFKQTGQSVTGLITSFVKGHPILTAFAVATGVAYLGLKQFTSKIDSGGELTRFQQNLGLTKDELKEMGPATVGITDAFVGLWRTLDQFTGINKILSDLWSLAQAAFSGMLEMSKKFTAGLYAGFVGTYQGIKATWSMLPGILGEAAIGAVNLVLGALEKMLNNSISGLNTLAGMANTILGTSLSTIAPVAIKRMENQYAGTGARAAGAFAAGYSSAFAEAMSAMDSLGDTIGKNIIQAAKDRLTKEAAGIIDDRTAKAAGKKAGKKIGDEAAKALLEALKKAADFIKGLEDEIAKMGKNPVQLKWIEIDAAIAAAPLDELKQKIREVGEAWEMAFRVQAQTDFRRNVIAPLEIELELVSLVGRERERRALALEEEAFKADALARGLKDVNAAWEQYLGLKTEILDKGDAREDEGLLLEAELQALQDLQDKTEVVGDLFANSFGRAGEALATLFSEYTRFSNFRLEQEKRLQQVAREHGEESIEYQVAKEQAERQAANAELAHYGTLLSAAKGLFKEKSTGYKVITALEKVYAAIQFANMLKSIILDKTMTGSSVANSLVRGAADAAAGAAKIFSALGPFAFPVVAAMVALLASLGLKGLGGGKSGPPIPSAAEVQGAQGTGTILGDKGAKSDSIGRALDILSKNSNSDLEYSNQMVRHLRNIEGGIGALTSALARQLGLSGGAFDTSGMGLGANTTTGLLGAIISPISKIPVIGGLVDGIVKALFGTTKTVTVIDQGIQFAAQTVQDIIDGGAVGQLYSTLQTVKKGKFFGISTGSKTTTSQQNSGLDDQFENQVSLIIESLRGGVLQAASMLGVTGAEATMNALTISLGKISIMGLSGDEIQKELEAVFSAAADQMAEAVLPGILEFQRAGEGLFETLARVAKQYATIDVALESIGMAFGSVGLASLEARESLIQLFGSLEEFTDQTAFFRQNFLTEAEQMAPVISAVGAEMARLGASSVDTLAEFKSLVLGLDLSTASGQEMYAALMAVAPAFFKTTTYLAELNGVVEEVAETAKDLLAIERQRRSLEIELMRATGDAAGALAAQRAIELAALDETLRPLQEQVWAALDAADAQRQLAEAEEAAATAAANLARTRTDLELQLMDLTGRSAEAEQIRREQALAAMDESLRSLQQQVWAAQDATEAADALARAQEEQARTAADAAQAAERLAAEAAAAAERLAAQRRSMDIALMEATGNTVGALAAKRSDELAALDSSLRSLQEQIWAAQDATAAQEVLAKAQEEAARTAAEAAQAQALLAQQTVAMQIRLLEAQGQTDAALALRREQEIAGTDASLRSMLEAIYAAEDATKAQQALAAAQALAADAAAQAAAALAAEAEALARLAAQRRSLEIALMEATGDAAGALAARREDELAALDASLHGLQQQIWAAEEARAAQDALAVAQAEAARAALEAAAAQQQLARETVTMQIRLLDAQGQSAAALALRREQEMAATDASLQSMLQAVYAAEDAARAQQELAAAQADAARAAEAAAAAQAQLARESLSLQIRLLEAQGQADAALSLRRTQELASTDASLHSTLRAIYAAEDAAAAQRALADAQAAAADAAARAAAEMERMAEAAARLNSQRTGLMAQLLEAQGDTGGATALTRGLALEELDQSLHDLQRQVWAAQDAAAAAAQAAGGRDRAMTDAERALEEAARRAAELATARTNLEVRLLELQGRAVEALALARGLELSQMDASLHGLQQNIWALEDAQRAQEESARAIEESTRAAEDAARRAAEIERARANLQVQLLELQGNAAGALALARQMELSEMDGSLHGLQRHIWALQDAQRAEEERTRAIESARTVLSEAYEREANALRETIETFGDLAASLRQFRGELFGDSGNNANAYRAAQARFMSTAALAGSGDQAGLSGLQGASSEFLEQSRNNATSWRQYQRDVAAVVRAVDAGIFAADATADYAQLQLQALDRSVAGLLDINENVISVAQAIADLRAAIASGVPVVAQAGDTITPNEAVIASNNQLSFELSGLRADLNAGLVSVAQNTGRTARVLERADGGDFLRIGNDADTPITTVPA